MMGCARQNAENAGQGKKKNNTGHTGPVTPKKDNTTGEKAPKPKEGESENRTKTYDREAQHRKEEIINAERQQGRRRAKKTKLKS